MPRNKKQVLNSIYDALLERFGPQGWWPADSALEVVIGAVLTQNTNWKNVERAIANLKSAGLLDIKRLHSIDHATLAEAIRPSGYYNVKARRLKALIDFIVEQYGGSLDKMAESPTERIRAELLSINGIGPETADSILLYAFDRPIFVVDAYTKRILSRHGICPEDAGYEDIRALFERFVPQKTRVYNEYHALIVRVGKEFCLKKCPRCKDCPLEEI